MSGGGNSSSSNNQNGGNTNQPQETNISVLIDDAADGQSHDHDDQPQPASHALVIAIVLVLGAAVYIGFQKRPISDDLPQDGSGAAAIPSIAEEKFEIDAKTITKQALLNHINPSTATNAAIMMRPAKILQSKAFTSLSSETQARFRKFADAVIGCDIPADSVEEVIIVNGLSSSHTLLTTKAPIDQSKWLESKSTALTFGEVTIYSDADDQNRIPLFYTFVEPNLIWASSSDRDMRNLLRVVAESREPAPLPGKDSDLAMHIGDLVQFRSLRAAASGGGSVAAGRLTGYNRDVERLRRELRSPYTGWSRDVKFIDIDVKVGDKIVVNLQSESDSEDNAKKVAALFDGVRSTFLKYLSSKSKAAPKSSETLKAATDSKIVAKGAKIEYAFTGEPALLEMMTYLLPDPNAKNEAPKNEAPNPNNAGKRGRR